MPLTASPLQLSQPLAKAQPDARIPQSADQPRQFLFLVGDRAARTVWLLLGVSHDAL